MTPLYVPTLPRLMVDPFDAALDAAAAAAPAAGVWAAELPGAALAVAPPPDEAPGVDPADAPPTARPTLGAGQCRIRRLCAAGQGLTVDDGSTGRR